MSGIDELENTKSLSEDSSHSSSSEQKNFDENIKFTHSESYTPSDINNININEMAAESKELNPENLKLNEENAKIIKTETSVTTAADEGIFSVIYTVIKKVAIVGTIYLVGYMSWSVAWLIGPIILSVTRDQWRKTTEHKRNIAKASAMACEKDVILARIDELPAWVYFPDVERCEWVNKILKQVWPNANHYARTLVKETIEPNVAQALSAYKLNGFKFDRIILGTIPPRIGGVKIYDKNVSRNEIIMDLDLFYASDCNINFYLGGMKGGIKDFQIHGMIRVIMKPLIRSMPLVGGLQIFFLNNPNIDFNLIGVIDLLDMPGLSDILRRVIVEQIAAFMVLPNKLPITLSEEVAAVALKMPEPEGVLRIHVVEAKDLMKKDIGVLGKGKSDPYALITVGAQEFKTQIIDNTVNPKWDYWCEATIFSESGQFLEITLFDKDETSNDEKLGRATIEISNVVKKGIVDTWLVLEEAKHGLLHVRLSWLKLSTDSADLKLALEETQLLRLTSMSTAILTIFVDSAKNLPQARSQSKPDPYLILSVGKHIEQTATQLRTDSPVWEQGFSFLVGNPDNDTLQMKIIDQKTGIEIGRLTYILSSLLIKKNLEIQSQPFQLQKSGPESKILMSLSLRILKKSEPKLDDIVTTTNMDEISQISDKSQSQSMSRSRTSSVKTIGSSTGDTMVEAKENKLLSSGSINRDPRPVQEDEIIKKTVNKISATPPSPTPLTNTKYNSGSNSSTLHHRIPDITSSAGEYNLGRIQLTLRYSIQRQKLTIIIHKIMNIPLTDPSNIPDPYVKLYLLPGRLKDSKRKTHVIKDNCNPIYDATFEYVMSSAELMQTELEVTVCTQKGFLSSGSPIIGMLKIPLSDSEISSQGITSWFDLHPEIKHD